MTSYSAPLKRFKLVVAVGIVAGAALALTSAYKVDFGTLPPKLTERESPTYTAGTQLEVSSPQLPYYRTAIDVPVVTPSTGNDDEDAPARPATVEDEPEVATLIAAANYYPYVIEGDQVTALRRRLYGPLEGEVTATAIGATLTPNRQEPGRLPFVQLVATSDSPQHAIDLAQQTADAFIRYVRLQQERSAIRPEQRLAVKQLRKPARTFAVGGTSLNLPILIFVALTLVSAALAFLLDRLFPRRDPAVVVAPDHDDVRDDEHEQPLVAASGREA